MGGLTHPFLQVAGFTHRPLSSSFLGLPYRILDMNHKKELLRGLWVDHPIMPEAALAAPSSEKNAWSHVRWLTEAHLYA